MIYKYTSIKEVIAKVYRDLDLQADEADINMIEWAAEALDHIGAAVQYKTIVKKIPVHHYKACLPCGFKSLNGLETEGGMTIHKTAGLYDKMSCENNMPIEEHQRHRNVDFNGFAINEGYINFNTIENGYVIISYLGIMVDDDNYPMIPDEVSYKEAIYRYIITKMYYPKMLAGKIPYQIYKDAQQEWFAYAQQAAAKAMIPDLMTLESIVGEWMQLVPQINRANNGFRNLGLANDSIYNNL